MEIKKDIPTYLKSGIETQKYENIELDKKSPSFVNTILEPVGKENKEKVKKVVDSLNNFLEPVHSSIKFKLHEELDEYYIEVINDNTNQVIREIPSKKLLDVYAEMTEFIGIMVDKKI